MPNEQDRFDEMGWPDMGPGSYAEPGVDGPPLPPFDMGEGAPAPRRPAGGGGNGNGSGRGPAPAGRPNQSRQKTNGTRRPQEAGWGSSLGDLPSPSDVESERSLLSTCCAPGAEVAAAEMVFSLQASDFSAHDHGLVFTAMKEILEAGLEINSLTLKDNLDRKGMLHHVRGFTGLVELLSAEEVGRPEVLVSIIRRKAQQRRLIRLGSQLARQAAFEEEDPEALVDQKTGEILSVVIDERSGSGLVSMQDVSKGAVDPILGGMPGGVMVGFERLDRLTNGFPYTGLIVLGARPGIGKTALALNWMLGSAMTYGTHGAYFTLEMSKEEVYRRMLSTISQVNMKEVQAMAGMVPPDLVSRIVAAQATLDALPIYVCDNALVTVPEIRAYLIKEKAKGRPVQFLIIDYLQLMSSPADSKFQSESIRIGNISRGLKLLAKEFRIPVVLLSQLNREVEHRQGGRPQLSDLRDSGAVEQDADMVLFIHRKMAPTPVNEDPDKTAELIIAKHRNGEVAMIPLLFEGAYAMYAEHVRYTTEEY